jgi:hypothetical protein
MLCHPRVQQQRENKKNLISILTDEIADDAVTADKIANSINSTITANTAKVTNATHSGEVTGATALTIADNVVDEANLKVSNTPTNGYMLTAQSGNTGGLTWAEAGGGATTLITTVTIPIAMVVRLKLPHLRVFKSKKWVGVC